jgi:MarR family transcriptional regulator for hemolysin
MAARVTRVARRASAKPAAPAPPVGGHGADLSTLSPETAAYANPTHSIGYLLRITFRGFSRALEKRTMAHGVSSGQWRFLRQLWLEDGLTQRELSQRVGMREPTTVVAVNSLEKAGFVRRMPSTEDRRKVHIHLTPRAKALQATLLPLVAEVNGLATAGLTASEVRVLRRALHRISENLAAEADGAPPSSDEASA